MMDDESGKDERDGLSQVDEDTCKPCANQLMPPTQ